MTVIGIGTDIVDIPTFVEQLGLPGSRLAQAFTARERRRAATRAEENGSGTGQHLAAVWALKEAFIKAWSGALFGSQPPLGRDAVKWTEIEIRHDGWGRPQVELHGEVAGAVSASVGSPTVLASASHDGDVACALVVLDK
ncbi:holo-ACP synthase [Scrofimicrobium sp. R131]|uniref:Holo-[acyl-carrier-protein] synthase n=1 Tax=Scrofimicrobium appendicitidis TaxID=3079930 RepID=A0AAU7V6K9_9ACTO